MAQAPTYKDLQMQKEARGLVDNEYANINQVADESNQELNTNKNPMLQEYMQQGLNPVAPVQNSVAMLVEAVMSGQIAPRQALADETVPPQDKELLLAALEQNQMQQSQQVSGLGPSIRA